MAATLPLALWLLTSLSSLPDEPALIRSAASGPWSAPATWEGGKLPGPGSRVQIRAGHRVVFDTQIEAALRSIHVAGVLTFDPDRDTLLTVGLIKIQAGDDASESGFDCENHPKPVADADRPRSALQVGTAAKPIAEGHTATIRLAMVEGLDPEECPAIVNCGARMEFHGTPMSRTWVKLGAPVGVGEAVVTLAEPVKGWRVGDRVIVTATSFLHVREGKKPPPEATLSRTEERTIEALDGVKLTLDRPLLYAHRGEGAMRGEVANLSRNVVVESAAPEGVRAYDVSPPLDRRDLLRRVSPPRQAAASSGNTASTSTASATRCGAPTSSGRRSTTARTDGSRSTARTGSSCRIASGFARWGTGSSSRTARRSRTSSTATWRSTPTRASRCRVRCWRTTRTTGAGFWWANSRNVFRRNVAVECDEYGFRFDAPARPDFDPKLSVRGRRRHAPGRHPHAAVPRFRGERAHTQRNYGVNLGGGSGDGRGRGVGVSARTSGIRS
ncbi:MAG: G8 domain-containing protein [Isosphaeraceae bacterium]